MTNQSTVHLLWKQLRPHQWTKNLLLYAALLFSFKAYSVHTFLLATLGVALFSLVASSIYVLNDYFDREADRRHPVKRFRPIASRALNARLALVVGLLILVTSIIVAFFVSKLFLVLLLIYVLSNVLYSMRLKHVVIIDMMIIASGFVIRAIAGAVIINEPFTPWFILCAMLLSLFLAIGKRRHELVLALERDSSHRRVLDEYSLPFLDQLTSIVASATIITYAVFTFTAGATIHLMWTIPFVVYGIFRYLYLIHVKGKGGAPDKLLFEDKHILVTVSLYVVAVFIILVMFPGT